MFGIFSSVNNGSPRTKLTSKPGQTTIATSMHNLLDRMIERRVKVFHSYFTFMDYDSEMAIP